MSRPKRTRPIFGKYWIESPRMTHKGEIISIRMKISQVQMLFHGTVKVGEIERGRVDGEEDVNPLHEDGVDANPE